jgi:hypothetical protein
MYSSAVLCCWFVSQTDRKRYETRAGVYARVVITGWDPGAQQQLRLECITSCRCSGTAQGTAGQELLV